MVLAFKFTYGLINRKGFSICISYYSIPWTQESNSINRSTISTKLKKKNENRAFNNVACVAVVYANGKEFYYIGS